MENSEQKDLAPIVIDLDALKSGKFDEFNVMQQMGSAIKYIMGAMFGGSKIPVTVKGSRSDVKSFAKTIGREKRYMTAYKKHGLNDPRTYKSVRDFERKTNLKWPFK